MTPAREGWATMKLLNGIWRLIWAAVPETASGRCALAFVMLGAAAECAMWMADVSGAALAWTGAGLSAPAAGLLLVAIWSARSRRREARACRESHKHKVLTCKAIPEDRRFAPIWIGQGMPEPARSGQGHNRPPAQQTEPLEASSSPSAEPPLTVGRAVGGAEELSRVDPVVVEIGYALVPLASSRSGEWLGRIAAMRRKVASELGVIIPPVRIRDNIRLGAHEYVIKIHGVKVGSGKLFVSELLALAGEGAGGKLAGQEVVAPGLGTPGVWIYPSQRRKAERMNYTVVDPASVLMTHLGLLTRRHAADLLSREQLAKLLDNLRADHASLVAEVTEKLKLSQMQKVLQDLLREGVSVSDLKAVLEAIGDAADNARRPDELTELARECLAPAIARQHADEDGRLWCVCLEPDLEDTVGRYLKRAAGGGALVIPRALRAQITEAVSAGIAALREQGRRPVVLCAGHVRAAVRQLVAPVEPDAAVLGHNEVKAIAVQSVGNVGIETARPRTYRAATVAAAMAEVKRDLGCDATILRTRKGRRGILLRLVGRRAVCEVTAVANLSAADLTAKGKYVPSAAKQPADKGDEAPHEAPGDRLDGSPAARPQILVPADHVAKQMTEIHRMVETLVAGNSTGGKFPPELRELYEMLVQQDVAEEIASQLIEQLRSSLTKQQIGDRETAARKLYELIAGRIATVDPRASKSGGRRVIALIGPTGVGKTTTIAKLAANFKLNEHKRVGLVTIDTYRIAAVDQLRTYANIIGVPLEVVLAPADLPKAVDSLAGVDVVLIDTAGRSQNDKPRLDQLRDFLADAAADETHLVISATSNRACTKGAIESFAPMGANRIILTKLDEAETFGTILNVACVVGAPISYVTTGQDVPDDISPADSRELAGRIMGGLVCVT